MNWAYAGEPTDHTEDLSDLVGDLEVAKELATNATAIYFQQTIASGVVHDLWRVSAAHEYGYLLRRVQLDRLTDAIGWLPSHRHDYPQRSSLIAVSEEHYFVGRVVDIDHESGTFGLVMREQDGDTAVGDEVPVRLPIAQVRGADKHRLRVGIRVDWEIEQLPLGDGSFSARSKIVISPPRAFTAEEEQRIQTRADRLAVAFAASDRTET